ncbi:TIGR03557 family F420-dependent LLM class oxidoreductase [Actinokineospora soli]
MPRFGYTLMTEQAGPAALVEHAAAAERVGFDFAVSSDHYSPWLDSQGHSPNAWSVLGAVTQVTERVELMTYVTCPIIRYHPAIVAQQAATTQILSGGRFTLGLGAGENLNEHVVGRGWPSVDVRHDMLAEAVDIISALFDGGYVTRGGKHFRVDSAKLWDLPETRVPIAVAVSGDESVGRFAPVADHMIAVEPKAELVDSWGGGGRKIGQVPVCWDRDRDAAVARAHDQFRWFGGGWKVNAELPGPSAFAGATQFVRPDDVAASIPCGPDVEPIVKAVAQFVDAGFTDVALVQIGGEHQRDFFTFAEAELLPALRAA